MSTPPLPGLGAERAANRRLLRQAVLVWVADPAALPGALATPAAWACLSAAEQARRRALHFAADRQLFAAAHVLLRHALAACLGAAAQRLAFVTNAHGRPELFSRRQARRHALRFSLSHSAGLVAVAVTLGCDVGVDVEPARPDLPLDDLTPGLLSAVERHWFSALPAAERAGAFTGLWTLKESLLKAYGLGIADELGNIGLVRSWQQPRAVLVAGHRLAPPGPAGVLLSALDGGGALAVSAFAPLQAAPVEPGSAPGMRQVLLFDLRPGRAAPSRQVCLSVHGLPPPAPAPAPACASASASAIDHAVPVLPTCSPV